MKKIVIFLVLFFSVSSIYAMNPADYLNKMPDNFKSQCFEYYGKIDKSEVWDKNNNYLTYKINIDKSDIFLTQNGFILPYKYYSDTNNIYNYKKILWIKNDFLLDYNNNTFKEINSKTQNEIILDFDETLEKNTFNFYFDYSSNNFEPTYFISQDKITWDKVNRLDIENLSFKYLKIIFEPKTKDVFLENIKIYELNFPKKGNTFLVKSFFNENIEIYSGYNCKENDFVLNVLPYDNFPIDSNTKSLFINLIENPKYNVYEKFDFDNDWVEDGIDNCKYNYNPDQKDSNWDWIWDICSDTDGDHIIWYYDNCVYFSNEDQKDVNNNGVWDVCEFDKDGDTIYDSIDNCVTIPNKDQADKDKDGIWDLCDNCEYFNPTQIDKDWNWKWDICDEKEKMLLENDKDWDKIIDSIDNCKNVSNHNQLDTDKDWVWDLCDNCKDIKNPDQLDIDKNKIWDMCEDSDNDWIMWYLDNCINIANPNQKDDDNNGVWNFCEDIDWDRVLFINDNCPFDYNQDQADIDEDKIWDKCDVKDDRFIESNKWFFIWLLVFIALVFGFWIFYTIKKINK